MFEDLCSLKNKLLALKHEPSILGSEVGFSQYASGETNRLGGITKRGNQSLRKMLIHGARTVLNWCEKKNDKLSNWLKNIKIRMHGCKAVVALANKLARIIWSVLATKSTFNVNKACA